MKQRRWVVGLGELVCVLPACGAIVVPQTQGDASSQACLVGENTPCACQGGTVGTQQCLATVSGALFGPCNCAGDATGGEAKGGEPDLPVADTKPSFEPTPEPVADGSPDTSPDTKAEAWAELAPEIIAETVAETVAEVQAEVAPEAAPDVAPDLGSPEAAPEATQEIWLAEAEVGVPDIGPDAGPEVGPEVSPGCPPGFACDDKNPCTNGDVCTEAGGCQGTPKCSDGVACTTDSCNLGNGACSFTPTAECGCTSDFDCMLVGGCYAGYCDMATYGCGAKATSGGACFTGDPCVTSATCQLGECVPTGYKDCSDGHPCTTDWCAEGNCVSSYVSGCCASAGDCPGAQVCVDAQCTDPPCPNDANWINFAGGGTYVSSVAGQFVSKSPAVGMSPYGYQVVAWQAEQQPEFAIWMRTYAPGGADWGEAYRVSEPGEYVFQAPAIAVGEQRAVIAYYSDSYNTPRFAVAELNVPPPSPYWGPPGAQTNRPPAVAHRGGAIALAYADYNTKGVMLAMANLDGTYASDPLQVSPPSQYVNSPPAVGVDAEGNVLVAWTDSNQYHTFVRWVKNGTSPGNVTDVTYPEHFVTSTPALATHASGTSMVVYNDESTFGLFAVEISPGGDAINNGSFTGGLFVVPLESGGPWEKTPAHSVAINGDGNWIAAFRESDSGTLRISRFGPDGLVYQDAEAFTGGAYFNAAPSVAASECWDDYALAFSTDPGWEARHVLYQADTDANGQPDACCSP